LYMFILTENKCLNTDTQPGVRSETDKTEDTFQVFLTWAG